MERLDKITDPNIRGQQEQNQVVNQQDQNYAVNPGPRENEDKQNEDDTLIDHSFEKEGYERNDEPEIETPSPKEDEGADSTERKIPNM
ncbi:MAG TPA: hypothetical protein VM012_13700 [Flavitalea sp.]|nr:hypothetical protein [Flavitalea sp.]